MKKETTILSTIELSIGYPSKKETVVVASGINISLGKGKLIALAGANGIGKSTLLRTITGIQRPLSGHVFLHETQLENYRADEVAQNMAIVLTESLPPSNLTVFELVALGRQPYTNWLGKLSDEDIAQVQLAMELTQTLSLQAKKHYEISDGQLQKVLIARALAQNTPLIILDEPTTHLDLFHKAGLLKLLKKLAAATGKCILYSTHDLDIALQLSDEIIVMTPGNLVQDTPQNLIQNKVFDTLFADENVKFDPQTGRFIIV